MAVARGVGNALSVIRLRVLDGDGFLVINK